MPEHETVGYENARRAWQEARLSPLWESPVAFKERGGAPKPLHWQWGAIRPLVDRAIELVSPRDVERRVLMFTDPELNTSRRATTTLGLNAGLQILLPGESARPHRHSMDAIRFVLEGEGAVTVVDGKEYPMEEGDLILTPGWCWYEHVHRGARPVILDRFRAVDIIDFGGGLGANYYQNRKLLKHLDVAVDWLVVEDLIRPNHGSSMLQNRPAAHPAEALQAS